MSSHEIELVSLDSVVVAKSNPKAHVVDDLRKSFARFGFVAPLVRDERTGRLLAGHGRLEALVAERDGGGAAPKGITVSEDGEWLVPVVRGVASRDDAEADAYLIADNQLATKGGWDVRALSEMVDELSAGPGLDGIGIDLAEVQAMMDAPLAPEPQEVTLRRITFGHLLLVYPLDRHGEIAAMLSPLEDDSEIEIITGVK